MIKFKKNTLVQDIHTGRIFIVISSAYKNIRVSGRPVKRTLMYKCIEPHAPQFAQIRLQDDLREVKKCP